MRLSDTSKSLSETESMFDKKIMDSRKKVLKLIFGLFVKLSTAIKYA